MRRQKATNELVIRSLLHAKKQHLHNDSATLYFLYIIDSSQSKEKVGLTNALPCHNTLSCKHLQQKSSLRIRIVPDCRNHDCTVIRCQVCLSKGICVSHAPLCLKGIAATEDSV